ncbi:aminopeptidase P family protein [Arcticibacterium luteifluviistationis]|uniref:Xaa-Pro aminopeptidase n=1 Tax=Arcticibacterium luteifluviistationis TaxID=1784714 RepID=A0A2Z4GGZ6_9BACT|nr:aminopeptidase P family protein [Arcticibacterium luteifluviistationis]AWW00660.1 Xaa-Pro aminopeptidase [Arcticibacterium luteifluviistationis]
MKFFPAQTYIDRRAKLKSSVNSGLILLMGTNEAPLNCPDNHFRYRQDSSFLYFFGINQPGLNAIIDTESGEEVLFGNEFSLEDIVWVGQQETITAKAAKVGVNDLRPSSKIASILAEAQSKGRKIHFLPPYRFDNKLQLMEWLGLGANEIKPNLSLELVKAVINLRSYKSEEEVIQMTHAVNISGEIHINAMRNIAEGKKEYEIVADIYRTAKANNSYLAYPPILSINGQILHNHGHANTMTGNRLVLNDSGAENEMCYSGDITRTAPVSGKFSTKQKEIYNIVLEMEESSIAALKAGIMNRDIHIDANKLMLSRLKELGLVSGNTDELAEQGMGGLFMPHGLGHQIGMDVHDMEDLGEDLVGYSEGLKRSTQLGLKSLRLAKKLEADYVITVEPGIYFIPELIEQWKADKMFEEHINYDKLKDYYDFGGIRIEDDILITANGHQVLGDKIPKTVEEVENAMAS